MAHVIVRAAIPGGYRKLGKLWPASDTEAEVTAAELEILKASPALIVVLVPEGGKSVSHQGADASAPPEGGEYVIPDDGPARKKKHSGKG